jgi:hypothetical protein
MDMGGLETLAWIFYIAMLPLISLVHCAAILFGTWFALDSANYRNRILDFLLFFIFTAFVAWLLVDYAIALANVTIVSVCLLARSNGFQLIQESDTPESTERQSSLRPMQFSLAFIVIWLPLVVGYLCSLREIWPDPLPLNGIVLALGESIILDMVYLFVIYISLKEKPPGEGIRLMLGLVWPLIGFFTLIYFFPEFHSFACCTLSILVFSVPILSLRLFALRNRGYRIMRRETKGAPLGS